MPKEEIVEGLRLALSRGENLMQAMMSFYNAGYTKQEVEEAAAAVSQPQIPGQYQQQAPQAQPYNLQQGNQNQSLQPQNQGSKVQPKNFTQGQPVQRFSQYGQSPQAPMQPQQAAQSQLGQPMPMQQQVSQYGQPMKKSSSMITVILAVLLIMLVGLLLSLFLFKDVISELIGNLA